MAHADACIGSHGAASALAQELLWFYQEGASFLFPDAFDSYLNAIPKPEHGDLMSAYYRRLTGRCATAHTHTRPRACALAFGAADTAAGMACPRGRRRGKRRAASFRSFGPLRADVAVLPVGPGVCSHRVPLLRPRRLVRGGRAAASRRPPASLCAHRPCTPHAFRDATTSSVP